MEYLEIARTGKNDWWRYLISFPGILIVWIFGGVLLTLPFVFWVLGDGNPATAYDSTGFIGIPLVGNFILVMITFFPFIIATPMAVRFIHARPVRTLITAASRVRWSRILAGAAVWFVLATIISVVESALYPGRYVLTLQPRALLVYAVFALLLIPIQTTAEELFFRGYLLQWMGLILKNKWLLALINGVLFLLPHLVNPEMSVSSNALLMALGYFAFGFFAALITVQDNGMELALGLHAANNLMVLFVNYPVSALPSPSVFTVQTLDATYGLISTVAAMYIFYFVFFDMPKRAKVPAESAE
jgi:membrane protease YdiL (CAAX protease family)